ncbi:hypothetical protein HZB58_03375 [Candidatus Gottesmanbacteria bacterium]|nr:hypothetical protein [Candidatus Gottesmanbacteria bacterium]
MGIEPETITRAPFVLEAKSSPPGSSRFAINTRTNPQSLWERMRTDGDILSDCGNGWFCLYPHSQYVNEDDGVHVMLSKRDKIKGLNLVDLTDLDLIRLGAMVLPEQKHNSRIIWGFNDQPDSTRKTGQTWLNHHTHVFELPHNMLPGVNRTQYQTSEHAAGALEEIVEKYFQLESRYLRMYGADIVNKKKESRVYPRGGLIFRFDNEPNPVNLAHFLTEVRGVYTNLLGSVGNILVKNPIDWIQYFSKPNHFPAFRNKTDRMDQAERFSHGLNLSRHARRLMRLIAENIDDPETPGQKLIRKQSYSIGGFTDENGAFCIAFGPRLKQSIGIPELFGIAVRRIHVEVTSDQQRRYRAKQLAQRLSDNARNTWEYSFGSGARKSDARPDYNVLE